MTIRISLSGTVCVDDVVFSTRQNTAAKLVKDVTELLAICKIHVVGGVSAEVSARAISVEFTLGDKVNDEERETAISTVDTLLMNECLAACSGPEKKRLREATNAIEMVHRVRHFDPDFKAFPKAPDTPAAA